MCSTQIMKKSPITIDEWGTMFSDFTTLTGSTHFIKKLMAVSLSALTYLRGIFPEKAYREKTFCGIKLKLLTEDSGIYSVNRFIDSIRSVYDAVDKKYLAKICIGICTDPDNRDEVLESYIINFRYNDDECSLSNKTSSVQFKDDPVVEATLLLLKSILAVSDLLMPLPQSAYLTMKLLYNDEITPSDYEPPGFFPSDNENFLHNSNALKLELGKISTSFNSYKMFLKTTLSKEPLNQMLSESQERANMGSQREPDDYVAPSPKETIAKLDFVEEAITAEHEMKVDCICHCEEDSGTEILQCVACGRMQHSICYGILKLHELKSEFCCVQCIEEGPFRSTHEDMIYTFDENKQAKLCSLRRALVFCASQKQTTSVQLQASLKCSEEFAKELIDLLELEGFIKRSGQKYIVKKTQIKTVGYQKYFPRTDNKEQIVESSLEEKKNHMDRSDYQHSEDRVINSKIEKLSLEGGFENQSKRSRRNVKAIPDARASQKTSTKKRCRRSKEPIKL